MRKLYIPFHVLNKRRVKTKKSSRGKRECFGAKKLLSRIAFDFPTVRSFELIAERRELYH